MDSEYENRRRQKRIQIVQRHSIDGQAFKALASASLTWLRTNQNTVNSLNVFPIPDGDTGTNMVLTMQSAYDEIENSSERNLGLIVHKFAHGALMGARGNSGVILSQIWRGFARALEGQNALTAQNLVKGFREARDTAYKGVVRPVEGTILTVIKDIAASAEAVLVECDDPIEILEKVVVAADESVKHTPELLPILKEAGVVDAGGIGLFFILDGMSRYIMGLTLMKTTTMVQPLSSLNLENTMDSVEAGQDFEVIVDFFPDREFNMDTFYTGLEEIGTSIQVGEGDRFYRMHIHVPIEKRYAPIDYIMGLGTVSKVAIENLVAQIHTNETRASFGAIPYKPVEPGQIAVVAVAPGVGIARVFAGLNTSAIIEGGHTMNPSTQEILNSFENFPTDKIIILPNNKNIILAAKSASELTVKNVQVIPTDTIPQGLAALMAFSSDGEMDQVVSDMTSALNEIESGEITIATRDVEIDGVVVHAGDVIGLHNGKLLASVKSIEEACLAFFESAHADELELITMFYGSDIDNNEANRIADVIRAQYPSQEVEIQDGGQPHYHFIISVE